MYENELSTYKKAYGRFPSQLNLVNLWHYKDIEKKKELDHIASEIDKILSQMVSLGIETPRSHDPKPKKFHSCKKLKNIH
jgi:hypothetical protein